MKKLFIGLLACIVLLTGCSKENTHKNRDWEDILKHDTLNVLTLSGSMSYFVYRDETMGYEYELLSDFAEENGLNINVQVVENEAKMIQLFLQGEGDLIAYNIPVTKKGKQNLLYCGRQVVNPQVLIQRLNQKTPILREVTELVGKDVWVIKDSKEYRRLHHLNEELGGGIHIWVLDKDTVTTEDLVEMVAKGKIDYTISDADLAKFCQTYFRNLQVGMLVGHPQAASWVVRKTSPHLAKVLDNWFEENADDPTYRAIVQRYFKMSQQSEHFLANFGKGHISPYDELFKKYAPRAGVDWQLLAAIAYHESNFYPDQISHKGATGLMGLMPKTAQGLGLSPDSLDDPESNIRVAAELIRKLNRTFSDISDESERLQMVLSAYNAGAGRVTHPDYVPTAAIDTYVQDVTERWQKYKK
jgi:membrane-bound lytic murein transglycosylase F